MPETVYVPAGEQHVEVKISASRKTVSTDEVVFLHAIRFNDGEWKAVKRNALSESDCWVTHPPPAREDEVADNIHWIVAPKDDSSFNLQPRADHARTVTFSEPGKYVLQAESASWCGASVDVRPSEIVIQVK